MNYKKMLSQMTLEEKIGQLLMEDFWGRKKPSQEIKEVILDHGIGGLMLFSGPNIDNALQVARLIAKLQKTANMSRLKIPLLICLDQEGGQLSTLLRGVSQLPGNMALGAIGDKRYAYSAGEIIGKELKAVGISVNYAPVLDVMFDSQNPVVDNRSFGADPDLVARLGMAFLKGLQSSGVVACAKHFPGQGTGVKDSHYGLDAIRHTRKRLEEVELKPFRAACRAGVEMIMPTHTIFTAFDTSSQIPATLSYNILTKLLRRRMEYQGIIITDDVVMKAIKKNFGLREGVVKAIEAGADMVMAGRGTSTIREVFGALLEAVKGGRIPETRIDKSIKRILKVKSRYAYRKTLKLTKVKKILKSKESKEEIIRMCERSITLIKDEQKALPLSPKSDDKILLVRPTLARVVPSDNTHFDKFKLAKSIRKRHQVVREIVIGLSPSREEIDSVIDFVPSSDIIIMGTINAFKFRRQAQLVKEISRYKSLIVVALRSPCDLVAYPQVKTYLTTYGIKECSMEALTKVLFGEFSPQGKLPVSIGNLYPLGHGLQKYQE